MPNSGGGTTNALAVLRLLRHAALVVSAAAVVISGAVAWTLLVDRAESRATRNAELVQAYMLRLIETQETVLAAADEALSRLGPYTDGSSDASEAARNFLSRLVQRIGDGAGLAFVAADGSFVLSSNNTSPLQAIRQYGGLGRTPTDGLLIDRMVVQPHGVDALVIARQPGDPAAPRGVWVAAVEIEAVRAFLLQIAAGGRDAASVVRADGQILVRNLTLGQPAMLDPGQPLMRAIAERDGGIYHARALTDGIYRYYATTRIGDYPLYATAGIARSTVLREWFVVMAIAVVVFGTIGALAWSLARTAERRVRAEEAEAALRFDRHLLAEAERTAAYRETMLRELNHRVKNSLQMIGALVQLQRNRPEGPDLDEVVARVQAIAAIHDLLYQSSNAFEADFAALLRKIGESEAIAPPESGFVVDVHADPLPLDVDIATPLALCAVELITNAAKHAYGEGGGRVRVELRQVGPDCALLTVADNGRGLPEAGTRGRRSGLRVVEELVRQIGGTLRVVRREGTCFEIEFPRREGGEERATAA